MDNKVFTYWTGKKNGLIKLLEELFILHSNFSKNYELILLDDDNIKNYIRIPTEYHNLSPNHKSDYIRANVLYKYGGLWLDADTIVMNDLSSFFGKPKDIDGYLFKENNEVLCSAVFSSEPGTLFLEEWCSRLSRAIKKKKLSWSEIGPAMIEDIRKNTDKTSRYKILNGLDTIYPVNWDVAAKHFVDSEYDNYINLKRDFQPVIILVNSVYKRFDNLSREDILLSKKPLIWFIKESIKNAEVY